MKFPQWVVHLCVGCCIAPHVAAASLRTRGASGTVVGGQIIQDHDSVSHAAELLEMDPSEPKALFKLLNAALTERDGAHFAGIAKFDENDGQKLDTILALVTNLLKEVIEANKLSQSEVVASAEYVGSCQHPYITAEPKDLEVDDGLSQPSNSNSTNTSTVNVSFVELHAVTSFIALKDVGDTNGVVSIESIHEAARAEQKCREELAEVINDRNDCDIQLQSLKESEGPTCEVGEQQKITPKACHLEGKPDLRTWAVIWLAHYEDKLNRTKEDAVACDKVQMDIKRLGALEAEGEVESCAYKKKMEEAKKGNCDENTDEIQRGTCTFLDALAKSCEAYHKCYEDRVKEHVSVRAASEAKVDGQQLQWRLLKRAECIANATDGDNVNKEKLDLCVNQSAHDTSHLNLRYVDLPEKLECTTGTPEGLNSTVVAHCQTEGGTTDNAQDPPLLEEWPGCQQQDTVLRAKGGSALFADLRSVGAKKGCGGNCKKTDSFDCSSVAECAWACSKVEGCNFWTYKTATKRCYLRKSDGGREASPDFVAGTSRCIPAPANANTYYCLSDSWDPGWGKPPTQCCQEWLTSDKDGFKGGKYTDCSQAFAAENCAQSCFSRWGSPRFQPISVTTVPGATGYKDLPECASKCHQKAACLSGKEINPEIKSGDTVFLRSLKTNKYMSAWPAESKGNSAKVAVPVTGKKERETFTIELKPVADDNCTSLPEDFAQRSAQERQCSPGIGRVKSGNIVYLKSSHDTYLTAGTLSGLNGSEIVLQDKVLVKSKMTDDNGSWQEFIIEKRQMTPEDKQYGISMNEEIRLKGHWNKYVGLVTSDNERLVADESQAWRIGSEWVIEKA